MKSLRLCAPGSGKTTRILQEAKETLQAGGSATLLAFGKKNAQEMQRRIGWLPDEHKNRLLIRTIHAEAYWHMKARPETNLTKFLFENDKDFGLRFSDKAKKFAGLSDEYWTNPSLIESDSDDDIAYAEVQRLRAEGLSYKDTPFLSPMADKVRHIWFILQDGFKRGYWDFLRLLEYADETHLTFKADYVGIDEINDLTPLQCRIVARSEGKKVVFCGDLNQSIYSFLGVKQDAILALPHETVEYQNESYRLPSTIAAMADAIVSRLDTPPTHKIIPLNGTGNVIKNGNFHDVLLQLPALSNALVLGRTNYIVEKAKKQALAHGANVIMSDDEILIQELYKLTQERPMTFPLSKLGCVLGSWVPSSRFWKYGAKTALMKKVGESNKQFMPWNELYEYGTPDLKNLLEGRVFLEGLRPGFDATKPFVRLMTTFAAKGLEEATTVVLRDIDTKVRNNLFQNSQSEIRLAYVACTRSSRTMFITQLDGAKLSQYLA